LKRSTLPHRSAGRGVFLAGNSKAALKHALSGSRLALGRQVFLAGNSKAALKLPTPPQSKCRHYVFSLLATARPH